jgi:hypothetical protein
MFGILRQHEVTDLTDPATHKIFEVKSTSWRSLFGFRFSERVDFLWRESKTLKPVVFVDQTTCQSTP